MEEIYFGESDQLWKMEVQLMMTFMQKLKIILKFYAGAFGNWSFLSTISILCGRRPTDLLKFCPCCIIIRPE